MKRLWCKLFGHGNAEIVEEYSREECVKYFLSVANHDYYIPHHHADIQCKWRCKRCHSVIIGQVQQKRWLNSYAG